MQERDLDRFLNVRKDLVSAPSNFKAMDEISIGQESLRQLEAIYKKSPKEPQFRINSDESDFQKRSNELIRC